MAKIRVYELARELNMKNKELLAKIEGMDISVASHMSSLDEEIVAKVKENFLGKPTADMIEVTRVKPTIIRRRKKQVPVEAPLEPETKDEAQTAESRGEEAPAETVSGEPVSEETAEVAGAAEVSQEPVAETPPEEAAEPPPSEKPVSEKTGEAAEVSQEPVTEAPSVPESNVSAAEEKPKPTPRRKEKKDAAAKVIQLPVKPKTEELKKKAPTKKPEREPRKKAAGKVRKFPTPEVKPEQEPPAKDTRKRKRKGGDEEVRDAKFFKKKISFRRKEVIEGEDLYAGVPKRGKRGRKGGKSLMAKGQKTQLTTPKAIKRRVKIDESIVLSDLAKRMGIKAHEMIATLMGMGVMATVNQTIDFETATLVATEFDYEVEKAAFEEETVLKVVQDDPEKLNPRPPVVTIMGHVDHGKTSLLDVIRKSRVTEGEAGGITQHIGAYHVNTSKGDVVFLDTPGHEAFTSMRSRGAQVTDIVVLVVAADDGVMPQTVEAINHARAAEVPILVAINKIDKANAEPDRVQRELSEVGLMSEDWGGDTIFVKVSAITGEGLDDLLEMILLQSEVLELKANADKLAQGHVVEAKLDSGRGPVATVLIQDGTLKIGSPVVCGVHYGKVRAMLNDRGGPISEAGPAMPVEVLGLSGVPMAGDELVALEDEKSAKQVGMHRLQKHRSKELAQSSRLSLEKLYETLQAGEVKDLNIIIKADVNGSIEALKDSLDKLSNDEVKISVVHSATGTISESDVSLAAVSDAIIIGFNVRPSPKVQDLANGEHVDLRFYNVIYEVIKDVQGAIVGMMSSTFEERVLGRAEIRDIFHIPRIGTIAGCYVTDGKIERGQRVRVLRDGVVSYDGKIGSLRRFKDDAREVQSGYECGIGVENFNDVKIGDVLECYYLEEIKPELDA